MSTINLSTETYSVLKNFASINGSIVIDEGSTISTIIVGEHVIARYNCEEVFPQRFAIYELQEFLNVLTLFQSSSEQPSLCFENNDYVKIFGNGRSSKYYFSDPEITINAAPNKKVNMPSVEIEFEISTDDIITLLRASDTYSTYDLVFKSENSKIELVLCDLDSDTSNTYVQPVKGVSTGDYKLSMKIENLRVFLDKSSKDSRYSVKISDKYVSEWKHNKLDLVYWIALEPNDE
jgi:hypothetical protein